MGCWSKEIKAALLSRGRDICPFCGTDRNTGNLIQKKRTERSLHAIIEEKIRRNLWKT